MPRATSIEDPDIRWYSRQGSNDYRLIELDREGVSDTITRHAQRPISEDRENPEMQLVLVVCVITDGVSGIYHPLSFWIVDQESRKHSIGNRF